MGHWVLHGITYGIPADPGGFLTGERLCIFGACTTPCPTPGKSVARWRLSMDNPYLEVISLVERLHRQLLEVVKLELEGVGIHDINNVQAMMLFNIGDAEMTVGELTLRGCYLGSNVSYNVKKMVENKYLAHERSVHDRRSVHVRLTEKGIKLRDSLTAMHRRYAEMQSQAALSADDLQAAGVTLRRLERFWIRAADLVQQPQRAVPDSSLSARSLFA
jgi:DNA-binding MarR family transcriptional regulator